ncbi:hypothetical protein BY458DRAFT_554527 [Sporodiniella umbellata]|nr:hypothetical protein BY458DRAFT_554527 [Sporodiniella umbellata]
MFRHVSKVASVLKYTHLILPNSERPSRSKCFYRGLSDLQLGIDALIEDEWEESRKVFKDVQNPVHSFGRAVLVYFQAILSFEYPQDDCIFEATLELLMSSPQHHLLTAHTTLMFASLQFLKPNWSDHLKAAYDIKKAYKMYEQLFQDIMGVSVYHYDPLQERNSQDPLEHGICLGLGLFYLALSFLPPKVNKILGHFRFRSVQTMGIQLLKRVSEGKTLYGPVSSLSLLYFYAHRSMYVCPDRVEYEWMMHTLRRLKKVYGQSPLIGFLEIKLTKKAGEALEGSLRQLEAIKKVESRMGEHGPVQTIKEYTAFKSLVLFEIGWLSIYLGRYAEAMDTFFCLESTCPLSRLFYHYLATCCMIAAGWFDKAGREVFQLVLLLESKRRSGLALSASESYAEQRVRQWQKRSQAEGLAMATVLAGEYPLWELVYLLNGTSYLTKTQLRVLQQQFESDPQGPFARLLLGRFYREQDARLALAYFDSVIRQDQGWLSCAVYETSLTFALEGNRQKALEHLKQLKTPVQDAQWKMCVETQSRFLLDSLESTRFH